jgi:LCP family protein required for cell wall assembly
MLNKNLDLDLHDYVTVDFNAVVKAVDLIGGVDVEVTEEELPYINGYQTENAQVTGAQITPVESAGYQHLNGIQALAYCRIRYTAGSDYRRTERQRTVLSQIFAQAKSQGPVKLAQLVDAMLPYIATSFSSADLLSLATSFTQGTLMDSVGFPFELQAANIAAGDCVVPVNLAQNVSELHAYLYQQNGYTPSETVQAISNEIANTTGIC